MSVVYKMARKMALLSSDEGRAARKASTEDLCVLLTHLEAFRIRLESMSVSPTDGEVTVTVSAKIPRAQMEHVGVEPSSEVAGIGEVR